ncbi:MAG: glycosyltransferase family 4 protein [Actinomycetota bacterium]|nr:glycosyltransferase family 4 protein [Actinomycetota bacterium]
MSSGTGPLRVALLSYRGSPHSGGQGVYVRYLSRALRELGHEVTVFTGPPYPDVSDGVSLVEVPSLELYRPEDPFRRPRRDEFRDAIDVLEYATMCAAGFPEPLTFSLRAARILKANAPRFDVVHDNQCLGYGLLDMKRAGLPVLATIHHPIPLDRKMEVANAPSRSKRASLKRWYAFTRMQGRVARRLPRIIAVSEHGRADSIREFKVSPERISVVHNGVDSALFRPLPDIPRRRGRIITTASADVPLKGLSFLIEAVAKLNTEREVELVVIGKSRPEGAAQTAIDRFGLKDLVRFESSVEWLRLVELYAEAEVAVVPSLYEGFSLPAAEAMSCGVALVSTTGGALPEVAGRHGESALLVPPGDAEALASAIRRLLDDRSLRERLGASGRERVLKHFSWKHAASKTVDEYRRVIEGC